jgi:hypothetical protein
VLWRQGAVPARRGASVEGRQRGQRRAIRERSDHRRVSSHEKHGRRRSRDLVVSGTVYGSVSRCIEVRALLGHITMHHFQERQPQRRATANDTLQLSQRALTITVSRSSVPQRVQPVDKLTSSTGPSPSPRSSHTCSCHPRNPGAQHSLDLQACRVHFGFGPHLPSTSIVNLLLLDRDLHLSHLGLHGKCRCLEVFAGQHA